MYFYLLRYFAVLKYLFINNDIICNIMENKNFIVVYMVSFVTF